MKKYLECLKKYVSENNRLLKENEKNLASYNYKGLCVFSISGVVIMFGLLIMSYMSWNVYFNIPRYHYFYITFAIVFTGIFVLTFTMRKFVSNHPLPLYYFYTLSMHAFAITQTMEKHSPGTYTQFICFLLLFPMCIMDKTRRIIMLNSAVTAIALVVAYYFKEVGTFVTDCVNCIIFSIVGIIMSDFFRRRYLRYADFKAHEHDREMEILKAKSEAKTSFLANMSHEIRTPINAVIGFNEMILRESKDSNIKKYAAEIQSASNNLKAIISDILDFSKIEAGKIEIVPVQYELTSSLNDLVNMITPRIKERGLQLIINVDPKIPSGLFGDELRLKQCVMNLLTNAAKYTNEGAVTFTVGWKYIDEETIALCYSVKDTGIGIKKENMSKLFSAFDRLEEQKLQTIEGTGLGLSITRSLLMKMGSAITVQSEFGQGSTFSFEVKQKITNRAPIGNYEARLSKQEESIETYVELFHAPEAKILIIDDAKINLTIMRGLLKKTEIQIDTSTNCDDALNLVKRNKYDIIFIDHRMPGKDGIETLKEIKELSDNPNSSVPCIAFTANAISGAREMFLRCGFVDYITKPIDYKRFEQMLGQYLPKDLIHRVTGETPSSTVTAEDNVFISKFKQIHGVDFEKAMEYCGEESVLKSAVYDFYDAIEKNAYLIDSYQKTSDFDNYQILVHSLKSSARFLGLRELSEKAKAMEAASSEKNEILVKAKTPELLKLYRSYLSPLESIISGKFETEKQEQTLTDTQFEEALQSVKECISADDFTAAENIISMISTFKINQEAKTKFDKIKTAVYTKNKDLVLDNRENQ